MANNVFFSEEELEIMSRLLIISVREVIVADGEMLNEEFGPLTFSLNNPNLFVIQADIYELPFELEAFSYIFSLGVLQHTPDPKKAFHSLPSLLKKDGKICVDYYEKSFKSMLLPKYWLRPLMKRIPNQKLFVFLIILVIYLPFLLKFFF